MKKIFILFSVVSSFSIMAKAETIKDNNIEIGYSGVAKTDEPAPNKMLIRKSTHWFVGGNVGGILTIFDDYKIPDKSCTSYCYDTDISFPLMFFKYALEGGVMFGKKRDKFNWGFTGFYERMDGSFSDYVSYKLPDITGTVGLQTYGITLDGYITPFPGQTGKFFANIGFGGILQQYKFDGPYSEYSSNKISPMIIAGYGIAPSISEHFTIILKNSYYIPTGNGVSLIMEFDLGLRYYF